MQAQAIAMCSHAIDDTVIDEIFQEKPARSGLAVWNESQYTCLYCENSNSAMCFEIKV